jgi:hypothetical protein
VVDGGTAQWNSGSEKGLRGSKAMEPGSCSLGTVGRGFEGLQTTFGSCSRLTVGYPLPVMGCNVNDKELRVCQREQCENPCSK